MSRLFDDGVTEYLQMLRAIVAGEPFSVTAWAYSNDGSVDQYVWCVADKGTDDQYHGLNLNSDAGAVEKVRAISRDVGNLKYAETTIDWSVNTWCHIAGVWSASNARAAYVHGGNKGTQTSNQPVANLDTTSIGRSCDSTPVDPFSGRLAEVCVWKAALSDIEVWLNAQGWPPWLIRPSLFVGFWLPFRDRTDRDFSGRGYHMTAFNTPTHAPDPPKVIKFRRPGMMFGRRITRRVTDPRFKHWSLPWARAPAVARRIFITHT